MRVVTELAIDHPHFVFPKGNQLSYNIGHSKTWQVGVPSDRIFFHIVISNDNKVRKFVAHGYGAVLDRDMIAGLRPWNVEELAGRALYLKKEDMPEPTYDPRIKAAGSGPDPKSVYATYNIATDIGAYTTVATPSVFQWVEYPGRPRR